MNCQDGDSSVRGSAQLGIAFSVLIPCHEGDEQRGAQQGKGSGGRIEGGRNLPRGPPARGGDRVGIGRRAAAIPGSALIWL